MNCKGCMYEGTDALFCCTTILKEAWNDFMKEMPVIRKLAKDKIECKHREDGYEYKEWRDLNRHG